MHRHLLSVLTRVVVLCVLGLAFASCGALGVTHEPKWLETTVEPPNETVLWQVTMMSLDKVGFPIGSGFEPGKLRGVTGWNTQPAPFKSEGFRERCYVEYELVSGKKYAMKVRVEKQTNEDIMHPLDISYAEWEQADDDEARAKLVVGHVKAFLGPDFKTTKKEPPPVAPK